MQYEDGGFPQFYPYNKGYVTQITYNDDAMINALKVLRDVARGQEEFSTVSENLRSESKNARKGCFLYFKTQLYHDGNSQLGQPNMIKILICPQRLGVTNIRHTLQRKCRNHQIF